MYCTLILNYITGQFIQANIYACRAPSVMQCRLQLFTWMLRFGQCKWLLIMYMPMLCYATIANSYRACCSHVVHMLSGGRGTKSTGIKSTRERNQPRNKVNPGRNSTRGRKSELQATKNRIQARKYKRQKLLLLVRILRFLFVNSFEISKTIN